MAPESTVYIVDDDEAMRKSLALLLQGEGLTVQTYASAQSFLEDYEPAGSGCILLDVRMPGIDGLELQKILPQRGIDLSVIMITGHGDVPMAVQAMKSGAKDFIEKPFRAQILLDRIHNVLSEEATNHQRQEKGIEIKAQLDQLTKREHQVFELLAQGKMNKHIADKLSISIRTVEAHRANVMEKLKAKSIADLVRLSLAQRT